MKTIKIFWIIFLMRISIFPQWGNDPSINLQLTNWGDAPISAVEDGRGGAFISTSLNVSLNEPPWSGKLPYLLWVDKYGYHKIDTSYRIGGYSSKHRDMKLMKDGTGNYFAVFVDQFFAFGPPSIYRDRIIIQKLDSLGNKLWGEGVYISTDTVMQHTFFEAVSDGKGGCFIYHEAYDSLVTDYGQRLVQYISSNGERLWGNTGVSLYNGFLRDYFNNSLLYNVNEDRLIVQYKNDEENRNYLIYLNSKGDSSWKLPTRITYGGGHKMLLLNQDKFAIIGSKYHENPFSAALVLDKISLEGIYEDSIITIDSSQSGYIIENVNVIDDKIFFSWKGSNSYFQKIDTLGNKYFSGNGIQIFDTSGFITRIFPSDSSFVFVTDHYARNINFEGNDLWQPEILQYTTRAMGYKDFISDDNGGFISFWLENLDGIWGQQVNANGRLGIVTTINDMSSGNLPANFRLYQNYPNPFNPVTTIFYSLSINGYVELKVFDVLGREIATLEKEEKSEGLHSVIFNGKELPSGVYFYTLNIREPTKTNIIYKATKKMLIIK